MITVTTTTAKPVAPQIDTVTLKLSIREARILQTIVANIGGRNTSEARQFIDHLYAKLSQAGVRTYSPNPNLWDTPSGAVQFQDEQDFDG